MWSDGVLQSFDHVERMVNDGIIKRVYVWECLASHSVGRPQNRWTDIMIPQPSEENGVKLGFVRGE